ncbi:MAG TPA: hypothetical protein VK178_03415 [Opitutaceae bacterium]|nr:hypothetical protein [Opitutaceae bacterium]
MRPHNDSISDIDPAKYRGSSTYNNIISNPRIVVRCLRRDSLPDRHTLHDFTPFTDYRACTNDQSDRMRDNETFSDQRGWKYLSTSKPYAAALY